MLSSRDNARREGAAEDIKSYGTRALPTPTDVADCAARETAADCAGTELGPLDVWVNVAIAIVFSSAAKLTAEEVERGTRVIYFRLVHEMMSALERMRVHNRGIIVNLVSALAYGSATLQLIYYGAKAAIRSLPTACVARSSMTSPTFT